MAALAIGPAHPVFYGLISGGMHPTGEPFVATNADNMIGSLAATRPGAGPGQGRGQTLNSARSRATSAGVSP